MNESIKNTVEIPAALYARLCYLGIIDPSGVRKSHVGSSNYSEQFIQPYTIWQDYKLDPWDADIVKRVLRAKGDTEEEIYQNRIEDYHKIIHLCQEKLRQLEYVKELSHKEGE